MDDDIAATVREWSSRSVETGYDGLRRLAGQEFSGVVETETGSTRAFVTNGRIVGVADGRIEDFEGATSVAYAAPDDALPLLFAMQERGGTTRAQYYSEETPLHEVDRTLEEGGFTGYVELSENVLSGDYYVVYHGGRSSSVAFVGNNRRLFTDDEAFERAADEVGIYSVVDADVAVLDLPDGRSPAATPGGGIDEDGTTDDGSDIGPGPGADDDAAADAATGGVDLDPGEPDGAEGSAADRIGGGRSTETAVSGAESDGSPSPSGPYSSGEEIRVGAGLGLDDEPSDESTGESPADATDAGTESATDAPEGEPGGTTAEATGPARERTGETTVDAGDATADAGDATGEGADASGAAGGADPDAGQETEEAAATAATDEAAGTDGDDPAGTAGPGEPAGRPDADGDAGSAGDDERRTSDGPATGEGGTPADDGIDVGGGDPPGDPNADPAGTDAGSRPDVDLTVPDAEERGPHPDEDGDPTGDDPSTVDATERPAGADRPDGATYRQRDPTGTGRGESSTSEEPAEELREARDELERLRAERDDRRSETEQLRERIDTLESRVSSGEGSADGGGDSLPPREALTRTNLFVRYASKGDPTLEAAHADQAGAGAVNENLRIERHTEFDADRTTVDGRPYEEFLSDSLEYRFARWVVRGLLYELRSTGNQRPMEGIYDAIPRIDRIEIGGAVRLGEGSGDGDPETRRFDVVFRNRMGKPLAIARLHDEREPATGEMVEELLADTRSVAAESLDASFAVATSYYEPRALEEASAATGGGFLSRTRRKSFVKLDRKRGFHLCLVEAREGEFNLNVPEL